METKMLNIKINGNDYSVPYGTTVLEAARMANIEIPTLCYLKDINEIGACRLCLVEIKGARGPVTACVYPIERDGTEIFTNTPKIRQMRKMNLELLLSNHNKHCLSCIRSTSCELQKLCLDYGVEDSRYTGEMTASTPDESSLSIVRDNSKCVLCRRCSATCAKVQGIGVIGANNRGFDTAIGCAFDAPLASTSCVNCGQCIEACPTGALHEVDETEKVFAALADETKHVVVQTAPSVRAGIAEEFGAPIGTDGEGKMVAALRRLGFANVFDTDFGADLTIMEEANEFLSRFKNGGKLPMITSCSPGWVKFCEHYYPEFTENLSTCKSPQQMLGAILKTYYAQKMGWDPKDIVSVSIMPCTAKKFEVKRDDQDAAGVADVDIALTTRELARMIRRAGIDFNSLPEEKFDAPLGISTGAGVIFGATGGVMEAALRTAVFALTGTNPEKVDFVDVRGTDGWKEASYTVAGVTLNIAVASGLKNAANLLDAVKSGEKNYQFIEIMCCPGGCVNGGGQPVVDSATRMKVDVQAKRAAVLYNLDKNMPLRMSHENPAIRELYDEFLGEPNGHKAHELLHTTYVKRGL
ncbi:MAG: NADH-dependent [FeFe] hydrogenase, group A6 [Eubacteriales bacterium]|nr:NADH-dependent [FeFe] hydrogenase, group A6 [Eubacteriales bacterium]MDY4898280.1 NADH-dependent [FeFe] hydrogenase, group A6 [Eubacteriales bacterium]